MDVWMDGGMQAQKKWLDDCRQLSTAQTKPNKHEQLLRYIKINYTLGLESIRLLSMWQDIFIACHNVYSAVCFMNASLALKLYECCLIIRQASTHSGNSSHTLLDKSQQHCAMTADGTRGKSFFTHERLLNASGWLKENSSFFSTWELMSSKREYKRYFWSPLHLAIDIWEGKPQTQEPPMQALSNQIQKPCPKS